MRLPRRSKKRAGFTLLELVISVTLMSVMAGMAVMVQTTGNSALRSSNQQLDAGGKLRRGIEMVSQELERAIVMNMFTGFTALAPDSPSITYLSAAGLVDGELVAGSITHIAWESDPRDANNGIDDDGDGLVDEGVIAIWRDVGEADQQRVVVATDITEFFAGELPNGADDNGNGLTDEAGLHFEQDGDLITVRICVQGVAADGTTLTRTAETSVRMRN